MRRIVVAALLAVEAAVFCGIVLCSLELGADMPRIASAASAACRYVAKAGRIVATHARYAIPGQRG